MKHEMMLFFIMLLTFAVFFSIMTQYARLRYDTIDDFNITKLFGVVIWD